MELNQNVLDDLIFKLKHKYPKIIDQLKIQVDEDIDGKFIFLVLIKIKKSQQTKGYGSAVMSEIISIADKCNVRVKLWATPVYGSELKRLYAFYKKHGFVLIKTFGGDGEMIYYPKKL